MCATGHTDRPVIRTPVLGISWDNTARQTVNDVYSQIFAATRECNAVILEIDYQQQW